MPHSNKGRSPGLSPARPTSGANRGIPNEETFHRMISLERKRTARSRKPFLLMLLDTKSCLPSSQNGAVLAEILSALALSTRETDITGWYKDNSVVGVMFTEIETTGHNSIVSTMLARVSDTLRNHLAIDQFNQVSISFHLFPEARDHETPQGPSNPILYPDLVRRDNAKSSLRAMKRAMDIAGSALSLILCAPLFMLIAGAIKLTSKGPVFFRQSRVGQYGVPFVFLKFRSMHTDSDPAVHRGYVREFIAGQAERKPSNRNGEGVYKLTNDSRVTKVGAFLRKTSLDELPQFFNVFRGEMSLVGPRPPIPYEVEVYDIWHRQRLLEARPGITGLWQVNGRSRVKFDEMVRLDLRYAQTWTPWLDVKILARTPRAVLSGGGAY
jgi:lipopolysaccharide/colanic/teichoic acid biosynthesis glycosyltransferase